MKILNQIRAWLSGKKTYLVGILIVIAGLIDKNNPMVLEGLAIITLRAGISKIGK